MSADSIIHFDCFIYTTVATISGNSNFPINVQCFGYILQAPSHFISRLRREKKTILRRNFLILHINLLAHLVQVDCQVVICLLPDFIIASPKLEFQPIIGFYEV